MCSNVFVEDSGQISDKMGWDEMNVELFGANLVEVEAFGLLSLYLHFYNSILTRSLNLSRM